TLRRRTFADESVSVVSLDDRTRFWRYAPDSVKFSDAKPGHAGEILPGDQLRARGQRSEDGLKVLAEEVVSGKFITRAGAVTGVDVDTRQVTITDQFTHEALLIRLTPDSQLKRMPDLSPILRGGNPGGGPGVPGAGSAALGRLARDAASAGPDGSNTASLDPA